MTDPRKKAVSLNKRAGSSASKDAAADVPRPTTVLALAAAMIFAGLVSIVAALTLYGQHHYLVSNLQKNQPKQKLPTSTITSLVSTTSQALGQTLTPNVGQPLTQSRITSAAGATAIAFDKALSRDNVTNKQHDDQVKRVDTAVRDSLKGVSGSLTNDEVSSQRSSFAKSLKDDLTSLRKSQLDHKQIVDQANKIPSSQLVAGVVLTVALGFVAFGAYAGRYWGRWAVPVIWVLCTFTGTSAGLFSLLQLGSDVPVAYKSASALSAAALLAAVILSFLAPTKAWWLAHRPTPVAGRPQRRGLFTPRTPGTGTVTPPARTGGRVRPGSAETEIEVPFDPSPRATRDTPPARAKKRVVAEATRNGAELARARAKTAAKSRRTEG